MVLEVDSNGFTMISDMKNQSKEWFRARQGYGWTPQVWQGWLVFFIWLLITTGVISWLNLMFENIWIAMGLSTLWCAFMLGGLLAIAKYKS